MRNKLQCGYELYFVIQEEHRGQHAKKVSVSTDVIERMIRKRLFKMDNVSVQLSTKIAYTEILLHMGPGDVSNQQVSKVSFARRRFEAKSVTILHPFVLYCG